MSNSIENEKKEILDYVVGILAFCGVTGWSLYYLFSLSPFFCLGSLHHFLSWYNLRIHLVHWSQKQRGVGKQYLQAT